MRDHIRRRVRRIFSNLDNSVEAVLIQNAVEPHLDLTFFYVTDLRAGLFEGATAVLWRRGGVDLLVPRLEAESAGGGERAGDFRLHVYSSGQEWEKMLEGVLRRRRVKRAAVNCDELTHRNFTRLQKMAPGARLLDASQALHRARAVKDAFEVERLRRAGSIASKVAGGITSYLKSGVKENEIAAELGYLMNRHGADRPSFILVSFGKKSSEPHYGGGNRKLHAGDFALLDFGAVSGRYHSDLTRTFVMGRASARQREVYSIVRRAQETGIGMMKAGGNGKAVHEAVAKVIDSTDYRGRFIHSTGHSLGLSVHDGLRLHSTVDQPLEDGMVFTVEPGIYIPGWGGVRIEDDVVVRKSGPEMLTSATRELVEL